MTSNTPSTTANNTTTSTVLQDDEATRVALLESLSRLSSHLPQSVLRQCIRQVQKKHQTLEEDDMERDHSFALDISATTTNTSSTSTSTTPLKNDPKRASLPSFAIFHDESQRSVFQARQERFSTEHTVHRYQSSKDLFATGPNTTGHTNSMFSSILGKHESGDDDSVSVVSFANKSVSHKSLGSGKSLGSISRASSVTPAQMVKTLESVERLLMDEDLSLSSTSSSSNSSESSTSSSDDSLDDLSSSSEESMEYQLDLEFDLQAMNNHNHNGGNNNGALLNRHSGKSVHTASTGTDGPDPKKAHDDRRLRRRKTGLQQRGSLHGSGLDAGSCGPPPRKSSSTGSYNLPQGLDLTKAGSMAEYNEEERSVCKLRQGRLSRASSNRTLGAQGGGGGDDQRSVMTRNSLMSNLSRHANACGGSGASVATSHRSGGSSIVTEGDLDPNGQHSILHKLPTQRYPTALLFCDISGFTKLSTRLSSEKFSEIIHSYFKKVVQQIEMHGGDIQKFAGDAIIAEWKPTRQGLTPPQAVWAATLCGINLVDLCSDFQVHVPAHSMDDDSHEGTTTTTTTTTLNVHAAVGYGEVVATHVGDVLDHVEYVLLGEALEQVTTAIHGAESGQIVASSSALEILEEIVEFQNAKDDDDDDKKRVLASKTKSFIKMKPEAVSLCTSAIKPLEHSSPELIRGNCSKYSVKELEDLLGLLAPYIHTVPLTQEVTALTEAAERRSKQISSPPPTPPPLAELRDVCTIFLQPQLPKEWVTGTGAGSKEAIHHLNQIMWITMTEVHRFGAHLRQFIVDDKGLVVIINFGLRLSTFPGMVEERAMPLMVNVRNLMKSELGIECKIGSTYSRAYCGYVTADHGSRTEYTVLGASVNLVRIYWQTSLLLLVVTFFYVHYPHQHLFYFAPSLLFTVVIGSASHVTCPKSWHFSGRSLQGQGRKPRILV